MRVPKILSQDKGMSLVEVMLAVGVSSGVMLAVSSSMINTQKSTQKISMQSSWAQEVDVIRLAMNDSTTCSAVVAAWNLTSAVPAAPSFPTALASITNAGTTYLTSGQTVNGITTQSIYLKPVPNFTTTQVDNGYSDLVYLEIKAQRSLVASVPNSSPSPGSYDLFSGYVTKADGTFVPINPISFTIVRDSTTGKVTGCSPTRLTCGDLGGTYVTTTETGHVGHGDPACNLQTLRLGADRVPGSVGAGAGGIQFGDTYLLTNMSLAPTPDSITDDIQNRVMTVAAGSLSISATSAGPDAVLIGPGSGNLRVQGPTVVDSTLKVNSKFVYTTACQSVNCLNTGSCGCSATLGTSYSIASGGVDCGAGHTVASSYYDNGSALWIGSCNGSVTPANVTVYCCMNTQ